MKKRTVLRRTLIAIAMVSALLPSLPVAAQAAPDENSGPFAEFSGGGWGHGVGLSQWGARARAEAGHTYEQILAAYYTATDVQPMTFAGAIKVHLTTSTAPTFRPEGPVIVTMSGANVAVASTGDVVQITHSASGFTVSVNGTVACAESVCTGAQLTIRSATGALTPVRLDQTGHRYQHGKLQIKPVSATSTSMNVMASGLTLDNYLLGLGEVPASWPTESLKAQAVAGRTYALRAILDRRASSSWSHPFDIRGTDGDQVYNGMKQETGPSGSRWVAAVTGTAGEVVTYAGNPIIAFYSSSNGGHSADSEYVFFATLPYLRGVRDPFDNHQYNSFGEWHREYDLDTLSRWLARSSDTSVGTVTALSITGNIGVGGRVDRATVTIVGTQRTAVVSGKTFRWRVNAGAAADGLSVSGGQLPGTKFVFDGIDTDAPANEKPPIGKFKIAAIDLTANPPTATLRGWALDPDTEAPILARVLRNGVQIHAITANAPRPAIATKYGVGPNHGIDVKVDLVPGLNTICLAALDATPGIEPVVVGCRTTGQSSRPAGTLAPVTVDYIGGQSLVVSGTATDADTSSALGIHVYVDGGYTAGGSTNATTTAFSFTIPTTPGTHRVCTHALDDSGAAKNRKLGCTSVTVEDRIDVTDQRPLGAVESAVVADGKIVYAGWALDPDIEGTIDVAVNVNGSRAFAIDANQSRPDRGDDHGFTFVVDPGPGAATVCVIARDSAEGKNTHLGCRTHTI